MKFLVLLAITLLAVHAEDDSEQLLKEFAEGNSVFTTNVYKELRKSHSGSFLVSPLSAETILALVHAGAKGNTAKQLAAGLQLPENADNIQQIFKELGSELKGTEEYKFDCANKVYVSKSFKINDQFKNVAVDTFHSEIQNIDFSESAEAANEINKWVEERTHNKIKDLIDANDIDGNTRATLVNALYFKGSWINQFLEDDTTKKSFFINNEHKVDVDMMSVTETFKYYECTEMNAKFLEMPYKGNDVVMTLILPNDKDGLSTLEEQLSHTFVTPEYKFEEVLVEVPKFKIETSIKFIPILKELGITDAFGLSADFSAMSADAEHLTIDTVIQKAFIEVNEEGTTAAASTAVIIELYSGFEQPRPPNQFIADHPFIFCLKYKNIVMFAGRYNPTDAA